MGVLLVALLVLFGALTGSLVTTLYVYWQLATGKRTVRPWK